MKTILRYAGFIAVASTSVLLLTACSSGSSSSTTTNSTTNSSTTSGYLSWNGNDNGSKVLDADGNAYEFSTETGCMVSVATGTGPEDACLTASSSSATGYAPYGPTNCSSPSTNSACNAASFDVVLTNDPSNSSGCIAVTGNGGASSSTETGLAITSVSGGFDMVTTVSPTAWTAYWNGFIPICGGSNPYAGTYAGTYDIGGWVATTIGGCSITVGGGLGDPQDITLTIDSGGIINNNTDKLTGLISSSGAGSFAGPNLAPGNGTGANCTPTMTITSMTMNSNGKWVMTESEALANTTATLTFTQQ